MFAKVKGKLSRNTPWLADIFDLVIICLITLIIAKVLTSYVILNGHVPSGSMETTIMTNDRIVAYRLEYLFKEPQRGDIVVFPSPDDKENGITNYLVKRIIGLPGETLSVSGGKVYINNQELEEPYISSEIESDFDLTYIPENCYFMMGDNRANSSDSRFWENKFVPREDIMGKVVLRYTTDLKNFQIEVIHSYNDYDIMIYKDDDYVR